MTRAFAAYLVAGVALAAPAVCLSADRSAEDAARVAEVTAAPLEFTAPERFEANPAGAGSHAPTLTGARPLANLEDLDAFAAGQAMFEKIWVPAPSSTRASDGLGPFYSARSCVACHEGGGGGDLPEPGKVPVSLVAHLGHPVAGGEPAPDPALGRQLQGFATVGHAGEPALVLDWIDETLVLSGGETASLRHPVVQLDTAAEVSLRHAPALGGAGLLAAIPEAEILVRADPDDADGDGISGRANILADGQLGRFGWKASHATIRDQVAVAFARDLGLSTPDLPAASGDCTEAQTACLAAPDGGSPEVTEAALAATTGFSATLGLPRRTGLDDPQILRGKALFHEARCVECHTPKHVTERRDDARGFQLIWPYTDLLLHDMGADLADGLFEHSASGAEWRTAPLWGLGTRAAFLHDGRARNVLEAILWHGGEAAPSSEAVTLMPPADRAALVAFLESL